MPSLWQSSEEKAQDVAIPVSQVSAFVARRNGPSSIVRLDSGLDVWILMMWCRDINPKPCSPLPKETTMFSCGATHRTYAQS